MYYYVKMVEEETIEEEPLTIKEVEAAVEALEPIMEEPAPKRKAGRPTGSKTCEEKKGKPRAPRKPRVVPVAEIIEPVVEERAVPQSRPIPSDNELLLDLLRKQANERKSRKQNLWKSWFT
jgi:hypothetical protein